MLEERAERLDEFQPYARVAAGERDELHQDHEADDAVTEVLAHPRGVRANDVLLQFREFLVADADVSEMPAAGVDPVDRSARGDRFGDRVGGGGNPPAGAAAKRHGYPVEPGGAQDFERDRRFPDLDRHGALTPGTIGRLRRCSRAQAMASS